MGVGPTLEFYALASRKLRLLGIWRDAGEDSGLFLRPFVEVQAKDIELCTFVG
jgi:hypothetical protein